MAIIIECELCPRRCQLANGQRGNCRARIALDGKLQTLVYSRPCTTHVDPIEKKPVFHVLPGSGSFSLATAGCNGHCKYCQNWQISQSNPEDLVSFDIPPAEVVKRAQSNRCRSIAYTYSEPIIFYEYTYDTSVLAKKNNLLNIMVTAGYIEQKPLLDLCPVIDAANVDLKGITEHFYKEITGMQLKPVQDAIVTMKKQGVWVELTNLMIPTWNDSEKDIRATCKWVVANLGPDVPLHFSRFWPMHQLKNLPPTPLESLSRAYEIAFEEGLHFPYVGNVPGHPGNNTFCPKDKAPLIKRRGYQILENNIKDGKCPGCGYVVPGIWS